MGTEMQMGELLMIAAFPIMLVIFGVCEMMFSRQQAKLKAAEHVKLLAYLEQRKAERLAGRA